MSSDEELIAENARLAARVEALEAQLAAKPPIDRATLYRLTDAAPWGVLSINTEGRIDRANTPMQRWLRAPAPAEGEPWAQSVAPDLANLLAPAIAAALRGERSQFEQAVPDLAGDRRDVRLTIDPRGPSPDAVTGAVVALYDLTETLAQDRAARENEARLAHLNAVIPCVIYIHDVSVGVPVRAGGQGGAILGYDAGEVAAGGEDLRNRMVHPDDVAAFQARLGELGRLPDGEVRELEFRALRKAGGYRWVLDRCAVFERDASGRVTKTISAAIDIDDRKRSDARRSLLINELNHRVKNTLAAVQSIARQTLTSRSTPEQALERFTSRLVALSAAHDVLTRESWEGAGLREVLQGALRPFETRADERIHAEGPDIRLGAKTVLGLSMALHELATNAVKYGALSVEGGHVDLTWSLMDGAPPRAELIWRERGGPAVAPPSHSGFGVRLLSRGLRGELGGAAVLDYRPEGLVCRIEIHLDPGHEIAFG